MEVLTVYKLNCGFSSPSKNAIFKYLDECEEKLVMAISEILAHKTATKIMMEFANNDKLDLLLNDLSDIRTYTIQVNEQIQSLTKESK